MTILCLLCGILNFGFADADSVGWKPLKDEFISLRLLVVNVGRTGVTAILHDGRAFVPMVAVFNYLGIRADYDSLAERLTGYYIARDTPYVLDAVLHSATIRDSTF